MNQLKDHKDFLHLFEQNNNQNIPEWTVEFQHIISISAITREGIDKLKNCIRYLWMNTPTGKMMHIIRNTCLIYRFPM